jgi:hypothetical protein
MKNLFERMTAENKQRFEEATKMFPATCSELKKDLQHNYFVINLEFRTVLDFSNMVLQKSFDVSEIFNSFENL